MGLKAIATGALELPPAPRRGGPGAGRCGHCCRSETGISREGPKRWDCDGPSGLYGNVPELRGARLAAGRKEKGRGSAQVIVRPKVLFELLSFEACAHTSRGMRDVRKSSVFKRGRFPHTQCYTLFQCYRYQLAT